LTFEREGETTQVAADGWPLYYWADDGDESNKIPNDIGAPRY